MEGRIVKLISNDYTVLSNETTYVCKSRGKFRNMNISPLVGDKVIFDDKNNYIMDVLPRKNFLIRPSVSNIDQAIIVASVKDPNFSTNLLDKLLVMIEFNSVKPIIVFSKLDLLNKEELEEINVYINYYKFIGYDTYLNTDIEEIRKLFKDKITVFTGQTGSGKSTLLNKLDIRLSIKTDITSKALGRGKHTTRHVELLTMYDGLVADTPGFSSMEFYGMSIQDIRDNFIEFNEYRENCKYADCMHDKEVDCAIKEKLKEGIILQSRYESYLNFIEKKVLK